MSDRPQPSLFESATVGPSGSFNPRCVFFEEDGNRAVFVDGLPVFRYAVEERYEEDVFVAQAIVNGWASVAELCKGLGRVPGDLYRVRKRFLEGGFENLQLSRPGRKPVMSSDELMVAERLWNAGESGRAIAEKLGRAPATVMLALRRIGVIQDRDDAATAAEPVQLELPGSARDVPADEVGNDDVPAEGAQLPAVRAAEPARSMDSNPAARTLDRFLAARGQLFDAAPLFTEGRAPHGGVLLAVPLLVLSGMFDHARGVYGHIGPAFYGLRTSVLTLLLLALLRIKRPENLKEYSPPALGRVLGLDRAPEVKTLRRKLAALSCDDAKVEQFIGQLAQTRVDQRAEALGFLYVDGHVRVYHGKARLPKTHVARLRLSLPATQELWVNDADAQPLFFVTQEAHPQLASSLHPTLKDIRKLIGPERRSTVVFDRGGWSPDLFARLHGDGFDVLTYRKGHVSAVPDENFTSYTVELPRRTVVYELHEQDVLVGAAKMPMRQITRRCGDHQTHIVTTRKDLSIVEVAQRMFDRWRQENFFKYMREEYGLDALVDYGKEPADPARMVPNPARKALDKELQQAKKEAATLEAAYGAAALDNPESKRPTMRGFKIAHGSEIGIPLRDARQRVEELQAQRKKLPVRVPVGELQDEVVCLHRSCKRLTDALKMVAFQVESDLVGAVSTNYARALDDGRRLIRSALTSPADILLRPGELHVRLIPQSSKHRTRAIAALCQTLTNAEVCYPGTDRRMTFSIDGCEAPEISR
jgi:hypothetical protein